ncbi:MAG: hypothetical protein ACRDMJ_16270, partial [Solirubrobacteraceae bacterium]
PRRVSGPAGGLARPGAGPARAAAAPVRTVASVRASVAAAAPQLRASASGTIAVPLPLAPPAPRPAPGPRPAPARPAQPRRAPARPAPARRPPSSRTSAWPIRALGLVVALPDQRWLDRLIRGRFWIPLLGVLLAGIVAMQVEVLKLNAGIGRALEHTSALQVQNEQLQASVAQLSDVQRIERLAAAQGMVMPSPQEIRFLRTGASITRHGAAAIHPPDATTFDAQVQAAVQAAASADAVGTAVAGGLSANTGATTQPSGSASGG